MNLKIEGLLPRPKELMDFYESSIEKGKRYLKDKKIIFSILCRNNDSLLERNIPKLINVVRPFVKDYRVVIYENDSVDNTKEVLKSLKEYDKKIHYISEDLSRPMYGTTKDTIRTTNLAEYRNFNLNYIKNYYKDYDYTIVCDSDFIDFNENGFYSSFGFLSLDPNGHNAIAGNSYTLHEKNDQTFLWNYDCWAYRPNWWYDLGLMSQRQNLMAWFGFHIMPIGMAPYKVNSAFGGMAIYKTADYVQGMYKGGDCEHVLFHFSLSKTIKNWSLWLNPSQAMLLQ